MYLQEQALLVLDVARRGLLQVGGMAGTGQLDGAGQLGCLASWIKDRVEVELGGGWQVVVGTRGAFGSCLSPLPHHYFNFNLGRVTLMLFKAGLS